MRYAFVIPTSCIKDLPDKTLRNLEPHEQLPYVRPLHLWDGGRACLDQIWSREVEEGERNNALYVLYQGLVGKTGTEQYRSCSEVAADKKR
jgi:hypothetical protein